MQYWLAVSLVRPVVSTLRVPGHFSWHGGQTLGARTLRVAPHDLARECTPLPVPGACSRVASRHEPSGQKTFFAAGARHET